MDGFRALAYAGEHEARLASRAAIHIDLDCQAVPDGEIAILDAEDRRNSMSCSGAAGVERLHSTRSICSRWMARICESGR